MNFEKDKNKKEFLRRFKDFKVDEPKLLNILTNKQLNELFVALKENKVIIIKGPQGPTGKSTLKKILSEKGYRAYEEYEIVELKLNKFIENPISD